MGTVRSAIPEALTSRKKQSDQNEIHKDYPFLTQKGIELIKRYTTPRTDIGMGRYASYKDYDDIDWRIGYGSWSINGRRVGSFDKYSRKVIEEQLEIDLREFSNLVAEYVFVSTNDNKKAAILSFAHSLGIQSFKSSRLLDLINKLAPKSEIIREWSPYINTIWRSGGEQMVDRRRVELDTFLAPDKTIPTFYPHKCELDTCLLNLPETYNGAPNQVKAIEYLERKLKGWDPSGEVLRRFFRYWNEKPSGLASPPRPKNTF